ncbi:DUF805 domain-containing protein [Nocardioides sp. Iso805N]|uniref:DUF805 domain-containing protein n=1 Tax=Nocardioides sp. Iso805N TaxID=1283287 RepID=UPI0003702EEC|nr:DUF805 domain-containing protein [Nocardioides sp. Iso805N]
MSYEPYPTSPFGEPTPPPPAGDPAVAPLRGATFGQAVQRFFQKYAQFRGRASRSEFWWWFLLAAIIDVVLNLAGRASGAFVAISYIWSLATLVPWLALGARRLHDTNRSGWWQLLLLIPLVGWIILIIWWALSEKPEGARFDV